MITNIESLRAHVAYHVIPEARRLQSEIHTTSNTADHASKYYALLEKVTLADTYLDNNPSLRRDSRCRCICNELKNSVALIDQIRAQVINANETARYFPSQKKFEAYVAYYIIPEKLILERAICSHTRDSELYARYDSLQKKVHIAKQHLTLNPSLRIQKTLEDSLMLIDIIRQRHIEEIPLELTQSELQSFIAFHIIPNILQIEGKIQTAMIAHQDTDQSRQNISTILRLKNTLDRKVSSLNHYSENREAQRILTRLEQLDRDITSLSDGNFFLLRRALHPVNQSLFNGSSAIFHPPIGIRNERNNCWANALFQCMINIPALRTHFLPHLGEEYRYFASRYLADRVQESPITGADSQALRQTLSEAFEGIISSESSRSEDASEAFMLLRGQVPEGERINPNLPMTPENARLNPLFYWMRTERHHEVTPEIAPYLGTSTCDLDNLGRSVRYDVEMQIIPELPKRQSGISFEAVMASYFTERAEAQAGRYNGTELNVTQITRAFLKPPEQLFVTPKRFQMRANGSFEKINTAINIPTSYSLPSHYTESGTSAEYELKAFIEHIGTFEAGHYIAYIRDDQGIFWKCNDQIITRASPEESNAALEKSYFTYFEKKQDLSLAELHIRLEERQTQLARTPSYFRSDQIQDDIHSLEQFLGLLRESNDQTKLRSAFSLLPKAIKTKIYQIILANNNTPERPTEEGKALLHENFNSLLRITKGWLRDQKGNLIEQLIYLKEKELDQVNLQMGIADDVENIALWKRCQNETYAEELSSFKHLLHDPDISDAQQKFAFMNLSAVAQQHIFRSLPIWGLKTQLEKFENISALKDGPWIDTIIEALLS